MAALSFYLMGGKPPISWMGSKTGYSETLAAILGLSRSNVAGFVWGDCGPNVAALAHLCGATGATAEDVAGWLHCGSLAYRRGVPESGFNAGKAYPGVWKGRDGEPDGLRPATDPPKVAEGVESLPLPATKAVAALIRSWKNEEPRALWERLKAKGWPSLLLPEGSVGRWLGPATLLEVAGYFASSELAARGDPSAGYAGEQERHDAGKCWTKPDIVGVSEKVESLPTFPPIACWQGRAEDLVLPQNMRGICALLDPPYKGDITTAGKKPTGYKAGDCSRESVLAMARDYDKRGAVVAICESVRLDRELGAGWYAVDISHARKGQARTFTKNQGSNSKEPQEWVTLNRPPQYYPPKQTGLGVELVEVEREIAAPVQPAAPVAVEPQKEQLKLW